LGEKDTGGSGSSSHSAVWSKNGQPLVKNDQPSNLNQKTKGKRMRKIKQEHSEEESLNEANLN